MRAHQVVAVMADYPSHLFVYGTLLGRAEHPMGALLAENGRLVAEGSIQARLYLVTEEDAEGINTYPGAVPSAVASDRVHGEVHEILAPEIVFPAFDAFEACTPGWPEPYEFLLRPVDVTLRSGDVLRAASYLYTWDTSRAELIASGRFTMVSPDTR